MELTNDDRLALGWMAQHAKCLYEFIPPRLIPGSLDLTQPLEGIAVRSDEFGDAMRKIGIDPSSLAAHFYNQGWIRHLQHRRGELATEYYTLTTEGIEAIEGQRRSRIEKPTPDGKADNDSSPLPPSTYLGLVVDEKKRAITRQGFHKTVDLSGGSNSWHIFEACFKAKGARAGDAVRNGYPNETTGLDNAVNYLNTKLAPLRIKVTRFSLVDSRQANLSKMKGHSKAE